MCEDTLTNNGRGQRGNIELMAVTGCHVITLVGELVARFNDLAKAEKFILDWLLAPDHEGREEYR
jgi:hypothetical protein